MNATDITLLGSALDIIALLLELAPSTTFPEVERDVLPDVYAISHSSLLAGAPFESLLAFFGALVEADMQIATHVVPNLVISVEKAPKSEASLTNVAKCIGQVVKAQRAVAAGTIAEFAKHLKVCTVWMILVVTCRLNRILARFQGKDVSSRSQFARHGRDWSRHVRLLPISAFCFDS